MMELSPGDEPWPGHRRPGSGPTVVLLHGFTQTGLSWQPIVERLGTDLDLYLPDAPGHGRSGHDRSTIAEYAATLTERLPPSFYVGYSMGGRTALHAALSRPDRVLGLVLIGATPGLETETERRDRRRSDHELAQRIRTTPLDDFLDQWLAQPLFDSLPASSRDLTDRRRNEPEGLASSLELSGTGAQDSLWHRLAEIVRPTLLLTGERDQKFSDIARRMTELMGAFTDHRTVPDRGHALHLEDPDVTARLIEEFVRRT